ncbi:MAG: DUF1552 domain-containing protein [Polyangiaceae bacterium]|nr:DUF1552 domain-containing protein [Polyangiaceae bacterium]
MPPISRRSLSLGLGAALLASPFVDLLSGGGRARADAKKTARRLVVFFTPNGTVPSRWRPVGGESSLSFPAGSILEPLTPVKGDLIVCDGVDFVGVSNHEGGMAAMLTGGGDAGSLSRGMSVDQFVASKIGGGDRFASLELGVQTSAWGGNVQTRMCYSAPGAFVPPDDDPASVHARLFAGLAPAGAPADPRVARRRRALDVAREELAALSARLGKEERDKLGVHLASLDKLDASWGVGAAAAGCQPAPMPVAKPSFADQGAQQLDLLVAALACGMTRVASLQWSHTVGPQVFDWLGLTEGHHALSHIDDSNPSGVEQFVKAERWYASQFAGLIDRLRAAPDPAGGTLLDSTLVVWAKELGDGRLHECKSVPFVMAGGGVWRTGRLLQLNGTPHQRLLVSICQAMGLTNQTFGDASKGQGPVEALWS